MNRRCLPAYSLEKTTIFLENWSFFFSISHLNIPELTRTSGSQTWMNESCCHFGLIFLFLEQLCAALNIEKRSVDRDLDVYRNLLSKLVQAKELLREYVDRCERSSKAFVLIPFRLPLCMGVYNFSAICGNLCRTKIAALR